MNFLELKIPVEIVMKNPPEIPWQEFFQQNKRPKKNYYLPHRHPMNNYTHVHTIHSQISQGNYKIPTLSNSVRNISVWSNDTSWVATLICNGTPVETIHSPLTTFELTRRLLFDNEVSVECSTDVNIRYDIVRHHYQTMPNIYIHKCEIGYCSRSSFIPEIVKHISDIHSIMFWINNATYATVEIRSSMKKCRINLTQTEVEGELWTAELCTDYSSISRQHPIYGITVLSDGDVTKYCIYYNTIAGPWCKHANGRRCRRKHSLLYTGPQPLPLPSAPTFDVDN